MRHPAGHVPEDGQPVHRPLRVLRLRQAKVHTGGVLFGHQDLQGKKFIFIYIIIYLTKWFFFIILSLNNFFIYFYSRLHFKFVFLIDYNSSASFCAEDVFIDRFYFHKQASCRAFNMNIFVCTGQVQVCP